MKYKLSKPFLNSIELARLNFYAAYIGYIFKFDIDKGTGLFETEDKDVGYIQRDEFNHIFVVWKSTEQIEYLDDKINICIGMHKHNLITETFDRVKMFFGINNIANHEITDIMRNYILTPKY